VSRERDADHILGGHEGGITRNERENGGDGDENERERYANTWEEQMSPCAGTAGMVTGKWGQV
jgi:hypothetical protein